MSKKSEVVKIFESAAREAGKLINKEFGKVTESKMQSKDLGDFVTNTDLETENILLNILKKHFSCKNHAFFIELDLNSFVSNPEGGNRTLRIRIRGRHVLWFSRDLQKKQSLRRKKHKSPLEKQ